MAFNLFDFSSKLNPLGNVVPTTPKASPQVGGATGGVMMPPTTSARPLPQTPVVKKPTFMENASELIIPKASASSNKMSVDEFAEKIKTKYPQYSSLDNKELADKMVAKYPQYKEQIEVPTSSESVFKDQYADEGIFKQGLKALPRALGNVAEMTAESIGTLGQGATNLLSKGYQAATTGSTEGAMQFENPYTAIKAEMEGRTQANLAPTSIGKDISKLGAGATTAAFNVLKAVPATAIQTVAEMPGGQYIIQAIGKGLDVTADMVAGATGMDKETAQNTVVTAMNTLGLKGKTGSTAGTITKAKQAFTGAKTPTMGTIKATASVASELGKNIKDVTLSPITATVAAKKGIGKIVDMIKKPKEGAKSSLLGTLSGVSKESIDILRKNPKSGLNDGTYTIDSLKKTIADYQNSPKMNPEKVQMLIRDANKLVENKKTEIENSSVGVKNQIIKKLAEDIDENAIDKRTTGTFYEDAKATPVITTEAAIKQPYYNALKETGIAQKPDGTMEWGGLSKASDQGKVKQAIVEINDIIGKSETPSNRPKLEELGFKFDESGKIMEMGDTSPSSLSSKGISPNEVTQIIKQGGIKEAATKTVTSNDILAARQRVNSLIRNLTDADTVVKKILTSMKKGLNETLYSLKPEMRELDSTYSSLADEAFALKSALFKTDTKGNLVLRDTAFSTIDSMTKANGAIKLGKLASVFPELKTYIDMLKGNQKIIENIKTPTIKSPKFELAEIKDIPGVRAKIREAQKLQEKLDNFATLHSPKDVTGKSQVKTSILDNKEFMSFAKEAFKEAGRTDFEKTIKVIKAMEETKPFIGKYGPLKQIGVGAGLLGGVTISAGIGIITALSLLATSPRFAGWAARKAGVRDQVINNIIMKTKKGLKLTPEDYKIIYGISQELNKEEEGIR